jgi:hypothetical protein
VIDWLDHRLSGIASPHLLLCAGRAHPRNRHRPAPAPWRRGCRSIRICLQTELRPFAPRCDDRLPGLG